MSDSSNGQGDAQGGMRSAEELQAHIEQRRQDLTETVDALAAKADVKARAKQTAQATKERAAEQVQAARVKVTEAATQGKDAITDDEGSLRPVLPIAAAVVVLGLVVLAAQRRRR